MRGSGRLQEWVDPLVFTKIILFLLTVSSETRSAAIIQIQNQSEASPQGTER